MINPDVIISPQDLEFRIGEICYKNRVFKTSRSCEVPAEVQSLLKKSVGIRFEGRDKFVFWPTGTFDALMDELFYAYRDYIEKKAVKEAFEMEYCDEELCIGDIKFSLNQQQIAKIISEGSIDVSEYLPKTYDTFGFMEYSIEEHTYADYCDFGNDVPEEFEDEYSDEEDGLMEDVMANVIKQELDAAILSAFRNLLPEVITLLDSFKDKFPLQVRIIDADDVVNKNREKGFEVKAHMELLNLDFPLYIDLSGEPLQRRSIYEFSPKTISKLRKDISSCTFEEAVEMHQRAFESLLYQMGDSIEIPTFSIRQCLRELFDEELENVRENNGRMGCRIVRAFSLTDYNNHKSDYYAWVPSEILHSEIIQYEQWGEKFFSLIPNSSKLSRYDFYYAKAREEEALFAIWSYFSSSKDNKRKDFHISFFQPFGISRRVKS